jgi:hypothetical protein
MSLCLTRDEIAELTSRAQPAAQRRWLDQNGWCHAVDSDGYPKVLRAYAEGKLGLRKPAEVGAEEPDFTVFSKAA